MNKPALTFIKAGEINGISPLPHYYEEIYPNQQGLAKIGIRGDKNYLLYSMDGKGTMFYEASEIESSAKSVFEHFQVAANRAAFFAGISDLLDRADAWRQRVDDLSLDTLDNKELAGLFLKANQFHGDMFTYYVVSQPYRMKYIETVVRDELKKRVAESRIDHYISLLTASEKQTAITNEEIDWLELLIAHHDVLSTDTAHLENTQPKLWQALQAHYEKHKTLMLGDGTWEYDFDYFLRNLAADSAKPLSEFQQRLQKLYDQPQRGATVKHRLIEELYLDEQTVTWLDFLAEVGHTRLAMRTNGWVPHVHTIIRLDIALSIRLDYEGNILNFMSEAELQRLADDWQAVPRTTLDERIGQHQEFLTLHQDGTYCVLYGSEARETYEALVPPIDHAATQELRGTTAVVGHITGQVCVYNWGDDLAEKIAVIKRFPILIAGQTRPAMMPLIRLAKGIVTDEGGVTSHAAIVSRELGIPSVIGTVNATKVFKDGDRVELDANAGIIRKVV